MKKEYSKPELNQKPCSQFESVMTWDSTGQNTAPQTLQNEGNDEKMRNIIPKM